MRKPGLILLALTAIVAMVLAAAPSGAQPSPPGSPKGQVFAGTEALDAFASPWVVAIGQGPNPVPIVFVDYETGLCTNPRQERLPAIFTGMVNVGPKANGFRAVTTHNELDLVCVNAEMQRISVTADFVYNLQTGTLSSVFSDTPVQTTLVRICTGSAVNISGINFGFNYINGTNGPDTLNGTNGPDIIDGRGGKDIINGNEGNDIVCAGNGNDVVHGNAGLDILLGEGGRDRLFGDSGKDVLLGGKNPARLRPEVLKGGGGWDRLFGYLGKENMFGGAGNDILWGGPGNDGLFGGPGPDDECYDIAANIKTGCETTGP